MRLEIVYTVLIVAGVIAVVAVATNFDPFALASSVVGAAFAIVEAVERAKSKRK